ncbi:hypothetical protein U4E84_09855 [Halorubrum sp. AD140]|uniref:hypothetical protein n=1 Tax=Halorubrum sp. AD140 TaxID=3050073 RepID=UPI002ACC42AD|nr:hypothetical protein [Halorubrum sp. AD140]MDZ5811645.1 hypothetical protein [Halorubrum sp. AD140]
MNRVYHVAKADFLQRIRTRRLVIVLLIVAYLGYLVNVGQIEIAYQIQDGDSITNVAGESTSAFIGLKAGLTGATVMLFAGFYLMKGALKRDHAHNVNRLVASTAISDRRYLLGKWVSNIGLGVVILSTLAVATIVNHAVHGAGPTQPLALVGPILVLALPLTGLIAALALLFETVNRLRGTLGNIGYFFLASVALSAIMAAEGQSPNAIPLGTRALDIMGQLAVYAVTADAVVAAVPEAAGELPSFGTLSGDEQTFRYDGGPWPLWIFAQRAGLLVPAAGLLFVAAWCFNGSGSEFTAQKDRWLTRIPSVVPRLRRERPREEPSVGDSIDSVTLTPVEKRDTASFWRLVTAEVRLAIRGRRWWWYAGALGLIVVPLVRVAGSSPGASVELARGLLLPVAFIWPIFIWSEIGTRTAEHRVTDLILSSRYPVMQLVSAWVAGCVVAVAVSSGLIIVFTTTGQFELLLGIASGVLFGPSLAAALGMWSRSTWLFEMTYLLLWYTGPLNRSVPVDFLGTTVQSLETGVPLAFIGMSVVLVALALVRRKLEIR